MTDSDLLDENVRYADVADVERYIRNKSFDTSSDPTASEVQDMILEVSGEIDKRTSRAWRLREATLNRRVDFSHQVESAMQRRHRRSSRHGFVKPLDRWGVANLKHPDIVSVEKLEVLHPESTEDITADKGRSGDWWVEANAGTLWVDAENFIVGPIYGGGLLKDAQVRVTYRYGRDENTTGADTTASLSSTVPREVQRATAMLVAAELIDTDQYGSLVASGVENVPDQGTAAQRLRTRADQIISDYNHTKVM